MRDSGGPRSPVIHNPAVIPDLVSISRKTDHGKILLTKLAFQGDTIFEN